MTSESRPATITLDQLRQGERAMVHALSAVGAERNRLMDLGFVPGSQVERRQHSPLGDPVAFAIRGTVIALRAEQMRLIEVTRCS